jgi:hypothetical protein
MSTTDDDPTQVMTPPPGKPRKKRHQRWSVRIPGIGLVGLIAIIAATSCSHPAAKTAAAPRPAASAPATRPAAATYPAQVADKALCATFDADMKTGDTASVQAALDQAGSSVSPGLATDVQAALAGTTLDQDLKLQLNVTMDCALASAGKAPPAAGFAAAAASQPSAPAPSAPASQPPAPAPAAPAGPTVSQQQALDSAQSYLNLGSGFSEKGLLQQLTSKYGAGFSEADAEWAVAHCGADWNAQAVMSAQGYMKMGGFSRSSLIDQLTSPYGGQFTYDQAVYAAGQVGL